MNSEILPGVMADIKKRHRSLQIRLTSKWLLEIENGLGGIS
jgi:hypothetical protein